MNDPSTYWLTFTNVALGVLTLMGCGAVGIGIVQELAARRKKHASLAALDTEVSHLLSGYDGHAFHVPTLGVTMADGGEPVEQKEPKR